MKKMLLLSYAVFLIFVRVGYGLVVIPTSPPYNVSKHMVHELKHCLAMADFSNLKKCCYEGLRIIKALFDDKPFPKVTPLTPHTCSKGCFLRDIDVCIKAGRFETEMLIDAIIRSYSSPNIIIPPASVNQVYGIVFGQDIPNLPPYNFGVSMMGDLKLCTQKELLDKYDQCCAGISEIFEAFVQNYYWHPTASTNNCNPACIAEAVRYHCTPAAEYTFVSLMQGILDKQTKTTVMVLPDKPPYLMPETHMEPLRTCVDKVPTARFQICCHGIATVFYALVKDQPWPTDRITADNCNVFCVEGLVKKFCSEMYAIVFREITHSVLEHYFIRPDTANATVLTPPLSSQDLWNAAQLAHPEQPLNQSVKPDSYFETQGTQGSGGSRPMHPLLQKLMESGVPAEPNSGPGGAPPAQQPEEPVQLGQGGKGPKLMKLDVNVEHHAINGAKVMPFPGLHGLPQNLGYSGHPGFPGIYPKAPAPPPGLQPINQGPPYNFQAPVDHYVKKCYNSSLSALFDKCCKGLSGVLDALMTDQPMPTSDITPDICNVYCVGDTASSHCVPEAKAAFMEISYAILTHYWEGKVFMIADKPPYHIPDSVMKYLKACQYTVPHENFENCCKGISNVFYAILNNLPLPTGQFAPHSCDIFCVGHQIKKYCSEDAEEAFLKLTYSAMIHYSKVMFQVCLEPDHKK